MKDSVLAKRHSDFESSSSVDCRDSDCSDSSACDSDTKHYQRTFTVVHPTAGAHDRHRDSRNPKSVATAEDYAMPFDRATMFLDLLRKQMLSGTWRTTQAGIPRHLPSLKADSLKLSSEIQATLGLLACMDQDPDNGNQPIRRFYLLCRGLRRIATKDIINTAVLWFATKFFKKKSPVILESASDKAIASAMYQPNTAQTKLKDLFQCFSHQGITYSLSKDFNGEGEIQAFF